MGRLTTTSNFDLQDIAKKLGLPKLNVVSIDEPHSDFCIINSDVSAGPGIHWTARYKKFIYDPFGMPPDNRIIKQAKRSHMDDIYCNTFDHQKLKESSCGYYCLHFLNIMHNSKDKYNTFYTFCTNDVDEKDLKYLIS